MENIVEFINEYGRYLVPTRLQVGDIIEILLITFLIYHIIIWVKQTRAWVLVKGLAVLLVFWAVASILNLRVILWIFLNSIGVGITALLILFQPELRKALEQIGQKNIVSSILPFGEGKEGPERFSDKTINELIRGTYELARAKTGALMVIEMEVNLAEYERTGIEIGAVVTSQLLINIFEHNTPLHDGAVIIRGDQITAATCYLPLSDNMGLSKELGTRHRAGVGISEVTDSFTIIVSEETGKVSIAREGQITRNVDGDYLRAKLLEIQKKKTIAEPKKMRFWRGKSRDEKKAD
ncbi:MAG TPA: TIGR00159 family protein [Candidatus Caccomorpha excrementavium]|nr:TIGR00159 family protein [Candidatus Caccomorpha excrementavium]